MSITKLSLSIILLVFLMIIHSNYTTQSVFAAYSKAPIAALGPTVKDEKLVVQRIADGLDFPTSMAFLGPNDILVTEKNTGKVVRVLNGHVQDTPVLDVPVASMIERGLLGIAVSKSNDGKTFVFLSYTESGNGVDGSDYTNQVDPIGNRLYRYEVADGKLINPVLLLDLTATPVNGRGEHNGGKIRIGPDNNVYYIVGEVGGHRTQAQNNATGSEPNGLGGVLRITQDGKIVDPSNPIFGSELPLSIYFAMGIRNSFGMDFDPVTGYLWDTENGPTAGDEINLVYPGFNSGWALIQGLSSDDLLGSAANPDDLVIFGKGSYFEPKLTWITPIGITALKFMNSDKMGKQYQNDMFVGDINNGLLYRLKLNQDRDDLLFGNSSTVSDNNLNDKTIDDPKENQPLVFGQGFGGITDIEVGPDGYLYVLSYTGSIFKIIPRSEGTSIIEQNQTRTNEITEQDSENSIGVAITGIDGDKSYSPDPVKIKTGQKVTWYNGDAISHTVTSKDDDNTIGSTKFDSGAIIPNGHYSMTFDTSGTYPYYCIYHPTMIGEVEVN
jgi:glucose/arabinose dehydrogenase/plastocyanin